MFSARYGDLRKVSARTDGDCHLCLEPADLALYGPTGMFGHRTVTVDHLTPQSAGGGDETENLLLAHGTCNSRRGTRDADLARREIAGVSGPPMSSGEKNAWSVGGGTAIAIGAGYVFAKERPDGTREFNTDAALAAGVLGALLLRLTL